jgi:hypothetical protein
MRARYQRVKVFCFFFSKKKILSFFELHGYLFNHIGIDMVQPRKFRQYFGAPMQLDRRSVARVRRPDQHDAGDCDAVAP